MPPFPKRLLALAVLLQVLLWLGPPPPPRVVAVYRPPVLLAVPVDPRERTDQEEANRLRRPNEWLFELALPQNRLVLYYGSPLSALMGPLGALPDAELVAQLRAQADAWQQLDPAHPVIAGLDYVTPVAQPVPMADGSYTMRMPDESIDHFADLAYDNHLLFFMDMQVGRSSLAREVDALWPYLRRTHVGLAVDPEFEMAPGAVPGVQYGRTYAAEINQLTQRLAELVAAEHLPPKFVVIHQFLASMLPDRDQIVARPGVFLVICMDGFGSPGAKREAYRQFSGMQAAAPGFKVFYQLDRPLMSVAEVLALDPAPLLVMYQ